METNVPKRLKPLKPFWRSGLGAAAAILLLGQLITTGVHGQMTFHKQYDFMNDPNNSCDQNRQEIITAFAQNKNAPYDYYAVGGVEQHGTNCPTLERGALLMLNYRGDFMNSKKYANFEGKFKDIKCRYDNNNNIEGLILAGREQLNGSGMREFELLKTDVNGNALSLGNHRSFGAGTCNKVIQARAANGTKGGFVAVGTIDNGGQSIGYVVKTDDNLNLGTSVLNSWDFIAIYGVSTSGQSVIQTNDGGFLIVFKTNTNIIIRKVTYGGVQQWEQMYHKPGSFAVDGVDVIEVMDAGNPTYYVTGKVHANNLIHVLRLDASGNILNETAVALPLGAPTATGITRGAGTDVAVSGFMSDNVPFIITLNKLLTSAVVKKRYPNNLLASPILKANDGGYIIGGKKTATNAFHAIKTLENGISECEEEDFSVQLFSSGIVTTPPSTVYGPRYVVSLIATIAADPLEQEIPTCQNYCWGVTTQTITSTEHVCYNQSKTLQAGCPGSSTILWYKSPNFSSSVGTGASLTVSVPGTYHAKCYNVDGCVEYVKIINVVSSQAPVSIPHSFDVCEGKNVVISSSCAAPNTSQWIQGTPGPTRIMQNEWYSVNCVDPYGCVVETHDYFFNVIPPVMVPHGTTICEGNSFDLNNVYSGNIVLAEWFTDPFFTIPTTNIVTPSTSTDFHGRITDDEGCISYHSVFITVIPAVQNFNIDHCWNEGSFNLDQVLPAVCTWTDYLGNVFSGGMWPPPGLGTYNFTATCIDPNGCPVTVNLTLNVIYCPVPFQELSTPTIEGSPLVGLYPNPTTGKFTVNVTGVNKGNGFNITIRDMIGKEIQVATGIFENEYQLDLSAYPVGIYLVEVESGGLRTIKKVVRQ